MKVLAQNINFTPSGGPTVEITGPLVGISNISDLINRVLLFILPFAAVILFFVFVAGGFNVLMSQGNPEKIKNGRNMITAGLIGFFILVFAVAIVKVVGFVLNINQNSAI